MTSFCRILLLLILLPSATVIAQSDDSKLSLNGYFTSMQSVMFQDIEKNWIADNLLHNRLNASWYPSDNISASLQLRNRLIFGETLKYTPGYADNTAKTAGWLNLSANIASGDSYVLNSTVDRLWFQVTTGKLVTTVGRQRINWGQNLVWNPNDIFNVYSYFDVDYPERSGSDAIRLQLYPNFTSTAELSAKVDSGDNVTAAALYRFNKWNYDIQVFGGILNSEDYVSGMGFSGNLKGAALRGEISWFRSIENFNDTSGYIMSSFGLDYAFQNSIMIQFEFLYSALPVSMQGFQEFYSGPLSVKNLAFTKYSVFAALSYPLNPLLQGSLAGMYFPEMEGFFAGPSLSYNLNDNIDLSLFLQYFSGKIEQAPSNDKIRQNLTFGFLRLKWNF